jgi:filamentous hemagglutinin family protein
MNNIYRSIWNEASGTFVAVSEHASSAGKKSSSCTSASGGGAAFAMTILAVSLMLAGTGATAAPTGGVVTAGAASIDGKPGNMVITQSSQNAVINWQSFNVAAGESVQFVQPNSNAVALNRVLGADPSSILGSLRANGKVFLVNPNGILFGKGASVNVGGLVASSLNIADADFMAGRYNFTGAGTGAIVNQGAINAPGGYVALLGAHVSNDGLIAARLGSVVMAAGNAMTLDVAGDGLLSVAINEGAVDALVQNGGLIQAAGGQVLLSARAAGGLLQGAVNNTGVIEAHSLENHNGVIRLSADGRTGVVRVSGTLDASGLAPGQTGGTVQVLGDAVSLAGATVNASGDAGGGLVQIGGNFHGDAALPTARTTVVEGGAVRADAIRTGNGGQLAVWSDGDTSVNSTLSARGGAASGNGGFIETSGKNVTLGAANKVNTLAPRGATGTWLLDPVDWKIAFAGGDETPDQVRASLASSDRLISATNDITVADALVWTTGQKLELNAGHDVLVQAPITASTAGSAIVLTAGNDVLANAAVTASATGSRIVMTAGRDVIDTATITATATGAKIALAAGRDASVATVTADGGGSVDVIARGNVFVNGQISADTGAVVLVADNDGTGPGAAGGTVSFIGPAAVNAMATTIRFNPATYASTTTEIANYTTKVASGTLDARAWVFAQGENKVYDGNTAATLFLRGNPETANSVNLVAGNANFADKNVGAGKAIAFDGYTLGGADQVKFALFAPYGTAAGAGATTADITPRPLGVTALATDKIYDGRTGALVTLNDNRVAGDLLAVASTAANFIDANVGNGKAVNVNGITVTGADAANYSANTTAATAANITPAPLIIQADNAAKTYGQTLALSPAAFTQTGLVNGETVASVSLASAGTVAGAGVAGSPYAIVPSNASGGTFAASNYTITYVNGTLVVTPAPLVIRANDASKTYGQVLVPTAWTTAGLVNGDSIASVALSSAGTPATASVAGSPYAIVPASPAGGTFVASNYAITYVNGVMTVIPAALTVTSSNVTKEYGETPLLTGFTATGLANGETIGSITATSPGADAAAAAPGPYAITPGSATGGTFTPDNYTITYATGALTVNAAVVPPPVVTPPVVVPPVVEPPVVVPPVVVPPVVVPPVVVPPVVVPPVVVPPVVEPPVVVPPVVVPPVVEPPVVVPPVVVPPVIVPPVVEPPVVVPPVTVPPVVVVPVVVPPPPVVTVPVAVSPAVVPPTLLSTVLVPVPSSAVPAPGVVLLATPARLESLQPPEQVASSQSTLPADPMTPVTPVVAQPVPMAPPVVVPSHRIRKQDRN